MQSIMSTIDLHRKSVLARYILYSMRGVLCIFVLLIFLCLHVVPSYAQNHEQRDGSSCQVVMESTTKAPITFSLQKEARVGDTVPLIITIPDAITALLPQGGWMQVKLQCMNQERSHAMHALEGIPETELVFHEAGPYDITVRLGYIVKSS